MTREVEPITVGSSHHDYERLSHPAFSVVRASRVSGHADLFGSHVNHQHYISLEISPATMDRNGYSQFIHGSAIPYIRVSMTEAQWASMIGSMNHGSGVPCTLERIADHTIKHHREVPLLPPQEDPATRINQQAEEMLARQAATVTDAANELLALLEKLPKKTQDAARAQLGRITAYAKENREFQRKCLRETSENLVAEAKTEIEATLTHALHGLGLQSVQQLGAIMAADPKSVMTLLSQQPAGEEDQA